MKIMKKESLFKNEQIHQVNKAERGASVTIFGELESRGTLVTDPAEDKNSYLTTRPTEGKL